MQSRIVLFCVLLFVAVSFGYPHLAGKDYKGGNPHVRATRLNSKFLNESGGAASKADRVWYAVTATPYAQDWPSTLDRLGLFLEDVTITGSYVADILPPGRKKLIHSVGCVARVKVNWLPNNYTGLFKKADSGIMRISAAVPPKEPLFGADNITPGFALKLFRDNVPSGNGFFMNQLDGQKNNFNPFYKSFSNHVPERPDLATDIKLLGKKFKSASAAPNAVSLSDLATFTEAGRRESSVNFPFALVFQPDPQIQYSSRLSQNSDMTQTLPYYFSGNETLYKIYALDQPYSATLVPQLIGTLQLQSRFTPSYYGDTVLFFKHQFIEADWNYRPSFKAAFQSQQTRLWEKAGADLYSRNIPPF